MYAIDQKEFQCQECLSKYKGHQDRNQKIEKWRISRQCRQPGEVLVARIEPLHFYYCPGNFFSYQVVEFLRLQDLFSKGVLPFPGTILQQPNKIIEVFKVIESYKHDKMMADIAKQKIKDKIKRGR